MVGDRLSTDIAMAARAGMDSVLVLTGETTPEMAAALDPASAPTWVLDRIDHLLPEGVTAGAGRPTVATRCD
jgi:ribonucleotide monophosphatase NagD (HAD superfamily)